MDSIKETTISVDTFFYMSSDLMFVAGKDMSLKLINPSFERITGSREDTIVGKSLLDFVHPHDREHITALFNNTAKGFLSPAETIARFITKNKNYCWINWKLIYTENEEEIYVVGKELVEGKTILREYAETKNKFLKIIDLIPHPIFMKDKDGRYILVNQAQADLFSVPKNEMLGQTDASFVKDSNELEEINASDKIVAEERKSIDLPEQSITYGNGKKKVLFTTKIPYLNKYSKDMSILGVSIDLTEMKQVEKELRKTNFELDSFVYHCSHDLKAPLCSLTGLLKLIKAETDAELKNHCINEAQKSIRRMERFISDLTDLSRNSRLDLRPEKIRLRKLVNNIFEDLKYMENADKIYVDLQSVRNVDFYSDCSRLRIILMNLISNSIKYQKKEGDDMPYVKIRLEEDKQFCKIILSDNGIGIEEQYLRSIFDMFFRASECSAGSGLGLYIVKQIVDKMNGNIEVESEIGKGTTFTIVLPNINIHECVSEDVFS